MLSSQLPCKSSNPLATSEFAIHRGKGEAGCCLRFLSTPGLASCLSYSKCSGNGGYHFSSSSVAGSMPMSFPSHFFSFPDTVLPEAEPSRVTE